MPATSSRKKKRLAISLRKFQGGGGEIGGKLAVASKFTSLILNTEI